jgi:cytochrome P450
MSMPPKWPLLGHLPAYRRDPLSVLERCAASPEPVVQLRIGRRTYVPKRPDDIRWILIGNQANYVKSQRFAGPRARRIRARAVHTAAGGTPHRSQRRRVQLLLDRNLVRQIAAGTAEMADRTLASWKDGDVLALEEEAAKLAFAAQLRAIFGADSEREQEALIPGIHLRREATGQQIRWPVVPPAVLPIAWRPSKRRALATLDRTVKTLLADRLDRPRPDFLSVLAARGRDVAPADQESLLTEAVGLSVMGSGVAHGLSAALFRAYSDPQVEAKLGAEVREAVGGRRPQPSDLPRLDYTAMVYSETLRLDPPTRVFARICLDRDTLPSGVPIEAGSKVFLSPYAVQRDPALYPDPRRFDPERFTPDAARERPRFAYFPFGGGPRGCPGRELAIMESVLILARIFQRFRLELLPGQGAEPLGYYGVRSRQRIRARVRRLPR